ncbi:hypothetical protein P3G55_18960 [Leptospira sp. 96542]|nr:hypothetical protein [Leptospira sp. 96542]
MTFSFRSFTLELTRTFLYAELGRRSAFVKFRSGFPVWDFEKRREKGGTMLWGLGMHAVISAK